jgi:hypothetical protein
MRTRGGLWSVGLSWCLLAQAAPPAFPGAEGFGATASGGRGGQVVYVTTLDPDPNGQTPGSLNWALRRPNSTVLFKVSGVIHAPAWVRAPNITIAGQTSPGGIIVRGLACDGHYERNDCSNLIVRHLRSRPALHRGVPVGGEALDDALRLDGIRGFIIDRSPSPTPATKSRRCPGLRRAPSRTPSWPRRSVVTPTSAACCSTTRTRTFPRISSAFTTTFGIGWVGGCRR